MIATIIMIVTIIMIETIIMIVTIIMIATIIMIVSCLPVQFGWLAIASLIPDGHASSSWIASPL